MSSMHFRRNIPGKSAHKANCESNTATLFHVRQRCCIVWDQSMAMGSLCALLLLSRLGRQFCNAERENVVGFTNRRQISPPREGCTHKHVSRPRAHNTLAWQYFASHAILEISIFYVYSSDMLSPAWYHVFSPDDMLLPTRPDQNGPANIRAAAHCNEA